MFPEASRRIASLRNVLSATRKLCRTRSAHFFSILKLRRIVNLCGRGDADALVRALQEAEVPAIEIGQSRAREQAADFRSLVGGTHTTYSRVISQMIADDGRHVPRRKQMIDEPHWHFHARVQHCAGKQLRIDVLQEIHKGCGCDENPRRMPCKARALCPPREFVGW